MKKIMLLAPFTSLPGESKQIRFQTLAERLAQSYDVELISSRFRHADKTMREGDYDWPVKTTLLPEPGYQKNASLKRLYSHHRFCHYLKRYLASSPPVDLVYSAFPLIGSNLIVGKWCKKHHIPLIIDVQDIWPESFSSVWPGITPRFKDILKPLSLRANRAYRQADALVAVSQTYLSRAQQAQLSPVEGLCVYIGSDDRMIQNADPEPLAPEPFHALYIGTLSHSYDVETLIRASALVKNCSVTMTIIGDGPDRPYLESLNSKLNGNVIFTGMLPYARMIGYLKSAQLAINPLKADAPQSITNKLSDYFTVGLPILSSQSCQETQTLICETGSGVQYEAGNPQSLASALLRIAKAPEKQQQMASASRQIGEQYFHRSQSYEKLVTFIDEQIARFEKNKNRKALTSALAQTSRA